MAQVSIPHFKECLASFLGDLRAWVFSSQSKAARHFGLSHTTISRYESGQLTPPPEYMIHLARLCEKRWADSNEDLGEYRALLLQEVNKVLRWCYPDHLLFRDWSELVNSTDDQVSAQALSAAATSLHIHLGEAPDVSVFFGREAELAQLERWVIANRCRLVAILGLGGTGKTFLATAAARRFADHFDWVIWHSLRNAPPIQETIRLCSQILSGQILEGESQQVQPMMSWLLSCLRQQRCLLVLDNLEAILDSGDRSGHYRPGYEAYGEFFKKVAGTKHPSCLLLTSREKPPELDFLPDPGGKIRSLTLGAISLADAKLLLQHCNLKGDEQDWQMLVERYSGNPLALKMVADTISGVFDREIGAFLETGGLTPPGLGQLLDEQFERATPLEKEILYWLASERKPVAPDGLYRNMTQPRTYEAQSQALLTLRRRSLIEKSDHRFALQNVVLEYVTSRFVNQICEELASEHLELFQRIALLKAEAEDYVRESQTRLILRPIAERLTDRLGQAALKAKLGHLVAQVRSQGQRLPGYAGGNLLNLMLCLGYDMRGADFSGLSVWQAFLRDASLPEVSFREADLSHAVFGNLLAGVNAIALSLDGRYLAIATDQNIQVWQIADLELYRVLEGHEDLVWAVAFAPDGKTLFSGSADHTVRVWDLSQGKVVKTLPHADWVWSVTISPDGTTLASAGEDRTVYVWDAQTSEILNELSGHTGPVRALAFSPDSQSLVSGGHDQTIRIWDVKSGQPLRALKGSEGEVMAVAFSPDGEWLLSGGADRTVRIWDWREGEIQSALQGHTGAVSSVAVNSDGDLAASGSYDGTIRLWDLNARRGARILRAHNQAVKAVAFDTTGAVLISGSYDQTVRFWEANTGLLEHTLHGYSFQIKAIAFSPDGKHLASCSTDYAARIWNIQTGRLLHTLRGHTRWVAAAAYSPTGDLLASGSYDRTVRLWHARTGRLQHILEEQNWIWALAFSPDGTLLAAAGNDPAIWLWEVETGRLRARLDGHAGGVGSLAFSPARSLLACGGLDHTIRLWNLETGEMLRVLTGHQSPVSCVAFTADGLKLVSVGKEQAVYCWDVASGEIEQSWTGFAGAQQAAISPDGRLMASGGADGLIHLTDLSNGKRLRTLDGREAISALAFGSQGDMLGSGSSSGTVRLWHLSSGKCLRILRVNRPYEQMDITGVTGVTESQKAMLIELGAIEDG